MQRSRKHSIFTKPTGTLTCGGYESTQRTSSSRLRRFRTADRTDCTYADAATIALYIDYDGCAMTGTTGTTAYARYNSRDDTVETIGRAERQPVDTAYDSIGQEPNNSTAILCNNADESTAEYCRRVPQEFSQTFTYDPLNRLTANTLGGAAAQSWTLDSQGNWSSVTTNGVTQTETANAQNQITSISGSATPTYDANGNMTTDQNGNTYVYNAWNQLVAVKNSSGAVIAAYTYDARGYRVTESYPLGGNGVAAGTTNYIYYDSQWQAIETRTNGTASSNVSSQMVLSASYINAAVLRDTYSAGVIQPNSRLYFEQDANWDTTAIVGYNATSGTWNVLQRFTYSPYGTITLLNADWSTPPAGTQPMVDNLYQGMTLDPVTGLYYARNRNYSPSLGTWISQDPLSYINGANTYQFVMGNPVGNTDSLGLADIPQGRSRGPQPGQIPPPGSQFQMMKPGSPNGSNSTPLSGPTCKDNTSSGDSNSNPWPNAPGNPLPPYHPQSSKSPNSLTLKGQTTTGSSFNHSTTTVTAVLQIGPLTLTASHGFSSDQNNGNYKVNLTLIWNF